MQILVVLKMYCVKNSSNQQGAEKEKIKKYIMMKHSASKVRSSLLYKEFIQANETLGLENYSINRELRS